MKKILLYISIVLAAFTLALPACKKIRHSTLTTPDNLRLHSYTKVISQNIIIPPTLTPVNTENYTFVYDGSNKVSQIFYTSNDSNKVHAGTANLSITFTYLPDTIYKTSTDVKTSKVVERDTFLLKNGLGQITTALFPNETHTFSYFGTLLANETVSFRDTNTSITANVSYTSNNGDWLSRFFDGKLVAGFPDSGIIPVILPGATVRDTILSYPISVTWTTTTPAGVATSVNHPNVNPYSDELDGIFGYSVTVNAVDANGVYVRTGYFPNTYCAKQVYGIYDFLTNRPGDYLQIGSFTTYGVNIYQNVHLLRSIESPNSTTIVDYVIDGESKITSSNVVIKDSVLKNTYSEAYKFQYEIR